MIQIFHLIIIDPCFDGTCVNNDGGFECQCNNDSTGHLCQYNTSCLIPGQCTDGKYIIYLI